MSRRPKSKTTPISALLANDFLKVKKKKEKRKSVKITDDTLKCENNKCGIVLMDKKTTVC